MRGKWILALLLVAACEGESDPGTSEDTTLATEDTAFVDETELRGPDSLTTPATRLAIIDTTSAEGAGHQLFLSSCTRCHTHEGQDIVHIQFADSTILRRAVFHNDTAAGMKIIAWLSTISDSTGADTLTPTRIPFQPGNRVLTSDAEFGIRLFGQDQWPANLTRDSLLKHNPSNVLVPLRLMPWSDEQSEYDWLGGVPDDPLPYGLRHHPTVQNMMNRYDADRTIPNAIALAKRVMNEAHNLSIPDAPCRYPDDRANFDGVKCGRVGDWIGTFLYTACLITGDLDGCMPQISGMLWEVGHLYHKAQQFGKFVPERDLQIAGWMHVSFLTDRNLNKQSSYETGALHDLGYPRMATWIALRTQVERPSGTILMCADAHVAALDGGPQWAENALTFAYKELQYRAQHNMLPANQSACAGYVDKAQVAVGRYAPAIKTRLQPLADQTKQMILN